MPTTFQRARLSAVLAALMAQPLAALAQTAAGDLFDLSIEQLTSIEVTSVAKRVQALSEVAGDIYVITREDLRRSGATSLPEALRLAPNLQVARADANRYAISARGLNSVLADKMLVQIDGRTVYSPLFSGTFWEAQDVMLEDVERIEVLSGSGGTLYGSNAVNGVISIITRHTADTQGALFSAGVGDHESALAARWGGTTQRGTPYRLYAKRTRRDPTGLANGAPLRDAAEMAQAGFRVDRTDGARAMTLQGEAYETTIEDGASQRRLSGMNLLGRWRGPVAGGTGQLQGYLDRAVRDAPSTLRDVVDTVDLDYQHALQPRGAHSVLLGAGWRSQHDRVQNYAPARLALLPAERHLQLWNLFAQDEYALRPHLKVTLGLKLEHNDYSGLEYLPSARLAWDVMPNHLLWAAASRSVRTPARIDRDLYAPALPLGSPQFESEVARVYELGWRAQPRAALSYAVTLFHHDFSRLRSLDQTPSGGSLNNNFEGTLTGLSAWAALRMNDHWRVNASYVFQRERLRARAGVPPPSAMEALGNDPSHRVTLGSSHDLGRATTLDLQLRRVGALPSPTVPAYTALDLRLGWKVNPNLELSVTGRNLNHARHVEWNTQVDLLRSVFVKAVWRL
ncbi:MAG: TonB-dependent receptor [Ramlibacter sp.]|nr:TonB-dependent receptor [Ramlibacter sp.]